MPGPCLKYLIWWDGPPAQPVFLSLSLQDSRSASIFHQQTDSLIFIYPPFFFLSLAAHSCPSPRMILCVYCSFSSFQSAAYALHRTKATRFLKSFSSALSVSYSVHRSTTTSHILRTQAAKLLLSLAQIPLRKNTAKQSKAKKSTCLSASASSLQRAI